MMIIPKTNRRPLCVLALHVGLYLLLSNGTGLCGWLKSIVKKTTKLNLDSPEPTSMKGFRESNPEYYTSESESQHSEQESEEIQPKQWTTTEHHNDEGKCDGLWYYDLHGKYLGFFWLHEDVPRDLLSGKYASHESDEEHSETSSHQETAQSPETGDNSFEAQKPDLLARLTSHVPSQIKRKARMIRYEYGHPLYGLMSTDGFILGDGHCQYRAVAYIIERYFDNQDEWMEKSQQLRESAARYLEEHPDFLRETWYDEARVKLIMGIRGHEYGEHESLAALTAAHELFIPCVSIISQPYLSYHGTASDHETIGLLLRGEHYELLFKNDKLYP